MRLTVLLMLFFISAKAQIRQGIVIDSTGIPVENAYILNTINQSHAHTNELGIFEIDKTSIGHQLNVSSPGFRKNVYTVSDSIIKIILQSDILKLEQVIVPSRISAMSVISKIDLQTSPVNSSQEILRKVPGLFIGQHAGGGKAEQIFLRGFDIDHGTDVAISVDGMPVNMVSHAHGQGYADLHFIIPETVEKIEFGKGSYYASKGDFATAGYVAFRTKEKIEKNIFSVEGGQFNTMRAVGLFSLLSDRKQDAYIATEYILTDGPFISPQNFNRINIFGKYTNLYSEGSKFSVNVSHFKSKWDASGQIPQRLVDNGIISRFGAVDDTEGGITSRTNVNSEFVKSLSEKTFLKANLFYSRYEFELYSNFTFFLVDSINGDQIKQKEQRDIFGFNAEFNSKTKIFGANTLLQAGFGLRNDQTENTELSHTANRYQTLERLKLGNIDQTNGFTYLNVEMDFGKLKINPAIRFDYFKFGYNDKLAPVYTNDSENKVKFSPKLNFIYSHNNNFQLYLKSGMGFHSNDTRVVVVQGGERILPTSIGADFGTNFKPFPRMIINSALWYLFLEQEFVYVGDAAIVEPSGRSERMGFDLGLKYQLADWLFFDTDVNYTYARSIDEPSGRDYIPLAPDLTATAGLSISSLKGFSGGFRLRHLKTRPANEDNSIVAKGYTVSDVNINYETGGFLFGISVENLFNTEWNETQFATESRLANETQSVTEIHFTPGTPFFMKLKAAYRF